jgi:peptidoglycan hydrolase CwlO-like protein
MFGRFKNLVPVKHSYTFFQVFLIRIIFVSVVAQYLPFTDLLYLFTYDAAPFILKDKGDVCQMDKLDLIIEKLSSMDSKINSMDEKLQSLEKGQKEMKKELKQDIADIHKYLKVGFEKDISRIKDRVSKLEEKVI